MNHISIMTNFSEFSKFSGLNLYISIIKCEVFFPQSLLVTLSISFLVSFSTRLSEI